MDSANQCSLGSAAALVTPPIRPVLQKLHGGPGQVRGRAIRTGGTAPTSDRARASNVRQPGGAGAHLRVGVRIPRGGRSRVPERESPHLHCYFPKASAACRRRRRRLDVPNAIAKIARTSCGRRHAPDQRALSGSGQCLRSTCDFTQPTPGQDCHRALGPCTGTEHLIEAVDNEHVVIGAKPAGVIRSEVGDRDPRGDLNPVCRSRMGPCCRRGSQRRSRRTWLAMWSLATPTRAVCATSAAIWVTSEVTPTPGGPATVQMTPGLSPPRVRPSSGPSWLG